MDILAPHVPPPPRRSQMAAFAQSVTGVFSNKQRQRIQINSTGNSNFVALMGTLQVLSMQHDYSFKSTVLSPEPRNQTEAEARPDAADWAASEWVEMDTIY
eukprot:6549-Rhodomonas_salina.1